MNAQSYTENFAALVCRDHLCVSSHTCFSSQASSGAGKLAQRLNSMVLNSKSHWHHLSHSSCTRGNC